MNEELLTRELAEIKRLVQSMKTTQKGRGFFSPQAKSKNIIYIGTKHGSVWYEWDHEKNIALPIHDTALEGVIETIATREISDSDYGDREKLVINILTDAGRYELRAGISTGFARCIVEAVNAIDVKSLKLPLTIYPVKGSKENAVLARIIQKDGTYVFNEDREEGKWKNIYKEPTEAAIAKMRQVNPQEYQYLDAKSFMYSFKEMLSSVTLEEEIQACVQYMRENYETIKILKNVGERVTEMANKRREELGLTIKNK